MDWNLSRNFRKSEFVCRHCGKSGPLFGLEILRTALFMERVRAFLGGRAITVNSAYRCHYWNEKVGGEPNSYHLRGMACDFTVSGMTPEQVQQRLEQPGSPVANGGMGRYSSFTHCDRRGARARWSG
ncbi:MAG: D-Ala-D-Ala carboxypeptidase family metallohydrolase [Actinomycetota bacterium]